MAHWIRGGGEQTVCSPASGAGKRTCYAEDAQMQMPFRSFVQHQEMRRRVHIMNDTEKISHDDAHATYLISRQPVDAPVPECDIPYRSIEPRDSPSPAPPTPAPPEDPEDKEKHIFYVLYEEGFGRSTAGRLQLRHRLREMGSHSSLPPAAGAHLWTSDMEDPYYASSPAPVHPYGTPPQWTRYEDWRERNCAYDMAADQEEESESRSFSPFVVPPPAEYRHTPEISTASSAVSHLRHPHSYSSYRDFHLRDEQDDFEASYDYYKSCLGRQHDLASHARHLPSDNANLLVAGSHPLSTPGTPSTPGGGGGSGSGGSSGDSNITAHGYGHNEDDDAYFITDDQAADNVAVHLAGFRRRYPMSRQERILRGLIHPKSGSGVADFELDDDALTNIMRTANDLFFGGRLKNRVQWDWSNQNSDPQYDCKIIGHTSLRVKKDAGGIETFVLLSTPILKNRAYSRRLLISAFLHELIHCYLFICCGWKARKDGGHTDGFRRIADTIDQWAGRDNLFLCQVEADLEQFRQAPLPLSYVLDQSYHVCRPAEYYRDQPEHDWWTRPRHHAW